MVFPWSVGDSAHPNIARKKHKLCQLTIQISLIWKLCKPCVKIIHTSSEFGLEQSIFLRLGESSPQHLHSLQEA